MDGRVYLTGKIEYDGNGTIEESGFKIKRAKDENATRIVAKEISEDGMFSIILDSDDYKNGFYYQAFASNKNGESIGSLKEWRLNPSNLSIWWSVQKKLEMNG